MPTATRNYLDLLNLTPNVHITQGPDGPEINVNGQKGTQTSFMVDGAGANNKFFGEQRGGQRPVANVSLEAVKEFQVVAEGAAPEFGGSTGAFINVVTKSGTNQTHGSLFELQELGALTSQLADGTSLNDYTREQFGGSIGGPIKKDKLFYFGTFEGTFTRFNKNNDLIHCCTVFDANGIAHFAHASAGGQPIDLNGVFAGNAALSDPTEAGPIPHTNDLQAFLGKIDFIPNPRHTVTFRDYFGRSIQENGTFDVPTFGRTANGLEKDLSNSFIASWTWALSPNLLNEFRFQFARDNRPRVQVLPPDLPDTSIGSCTTGTGEDAPPTIGCLGRNFRFGRPFFHPSSVVDKQFQVNNNVSIVHGSHAIKVGFNTLNIREANFFQGFARGRMTFDSVEGFLNYVNLGPGFVECSDGTSGTATIGSPSCLGASPSSSIVGPLELYLQFAPVGGRTLAQASENDFPQFEAGVFVQDKWQATRGLTISYGLRWDNYNQRAPALDPATTRIGQFLSLPNFPSNGLVPGYHKAFQPRLGIAWDPWNNGKTVIRLNGGVFYSDLPAIIVANGTANNGSIAGTVFEASFFNGFGVQPPAYPNCATGPATAAGCPTPTGDLFDPQVVLFAKNFPYPRTYAGSAWVERELSSAWKVSAGFNYALGTHQNRNLLMNPP
ncbi:MAG: TonB-dependent receptor, partial [Acidobacteriaceae bacterium]|nr:TonB-dependent receptor [Acidobacteriaceae bacterium]